MRRNGARAAFWFWMALTIAATIFLLLLTLRSFSE